jgi:hypothetical protein
MSCSKPKRAKTSSLWTYFSITDDNTKTCRCELCGLLLSYRSTLNNLKKHIERRHVTVNLSADKTSPRPSNNLDSKSSCTSSSQVLEEPNIDDPEELNTATSMSTEVLEHAASGKPLNKPKPNISKQTSISSYVPKKIGICQKKKIDKAFLRLFFSDFQPFSIVEDSGFIEFVNALNPSYSLPSRKSISRNLIPLAFEECKRHVNNLLRENDHICLTLDTWTSSVNEGYLAVTGHFLGSNFILNSVLLDCVLIEGSHTSEHLAEEIRKIIVEYEISNKVLVIVTDNANNVVSAVKKELKLNHWPCFGHTLNLIVQDALKKVSPLIDKCKQIVTYFKRSNAATEILVKYQRNSGSKDPKKLIQDVCTRWNSTYFMLSRFVELQEAVRSSLGLIDKELPTITADDWCSLADLCKVLKPFEQVTAKLSGENYLTGSQIVVLTLGLQSVCSKLLSKNLQKNVKDVVTDLLVGLLDRFGNVEMNKLVGVSTFLDPRFKLFPYSDDKFKDSIKKHMISLVTSVISQQSNVYAPTTNQGESSSNEAQRPSNTNDCVEEEFEVFEYFDSIMKNIKPQSSGSPHARAIIEIDR